MKKKIFPICLVFLIALVLIIINVNKYFNNIIAVVIPHHNLVKAERLEFWEEVLEENKIDKDKINKIIIVSPDHFSDNKKDVTYDDTNWSTYDGELQNFFERPKYFPSNYNLNSKLVRRDHGIANLITEIYDTFPNAKFVPFLIGEEVKFEELEYLISYINENCNKNCILVTSVDFSHYVTLDVINKQDENTIKLLKDKAIKENSLNQNNTIEADSPASLYVMQEFARENNLDWKLYNQTNSANGDYEMTDTTSHIFGAFIKK